MSAGSFVQFRLDNVDPRHGQPGGTAGQPPLMADGSVDEGQAWAQALGATQDNELALLRTAALSRFPQYVPADGLDKLGQGEFVLPRFPNEADDTYRARLEQAFPTYDLGASPDAIVASLQAWGLGDVVVLPVWQPPAPYLPETSATSYSEFYVFLGPDMGSTGIAPLVLGSWTLGASPGSTLGSSMTPTQLVAIKSQILRWKYALGMPIKLGLYFTVVGGSPFPPSATAMATYPIGRCLGDTLPPLGDPAFILGGFQL